MAAYITHSKNTNSLKSQGVLVSRRYGQAHKGFHAVILKCKLLELSRMYVCAAEYAVVDNCIGNPQTFISMYIRLNSA